MDDFSAVYGDLAKAATLYASNGITQLDTTRCVMTNARNVPLANTRGDRLVGRIPSGSAADQLTAGQILRVPDRRPGWYIVVSVLDRSTTTLLDPGLAFSLLALPLEVTVRHTVIPTTVGVLDSYGAPRAVDSQGYPSEITVQQVTVRAGLSNDFEPLTEDVSGVKPGGLQTLYLPLGSGVVEDDEVLLPGGQPARVGTLNQLASFGAAYALQAILATSVGSGYRPSS